MLTRRGAAGGPFDLEDAKRIAEGLSDSYLFIQGPPGSGKTYTGAQLILHLIRRATRRRRVRQPHGDPQPARRGREGAPAGEPFSGAEEVRQRREQQLRVGARPDRELQENADFAAGELQLVAGTAWLFCREELDGTLDYLFIDEAGQVSLADALAMGTCARNVMLLGDPQQLAQVSQAVHPPGAGASVLEHLLGEHTTIPPERGLFLDETRRMHPDVCRFISEAIYEGRLESSRTAPTSAIDAPGGLTGPGCGTSRSSTRATRASRPRRPRRSPGGRGSAARGSTSRTDGTSGPLDARGHHGRRPLQRPGALPARAPPDGVRIGTVDKFQGQEAAVCFFSMATSSGEEIPRNLEFLFSRNRLNVAMSRARCLAVLVCSPELLHIRCRSAEQMRLVNALCWFVEMAGEQTVTTI